MPNSSPCADDPYPLEFCADVHAEENPDPEAWACAIRACPIPAQSNTDCFTLTELTAKNVDASHSCIFAWPGLESEESDSASMGSGTFTGTTSGTGTGSGTATSSSEAGVSTSSDATDSDSLGSSESTTGDDSSTDEGELEDTTGGDEETSGGEQCTADQCKNGGFCQDDECQCVDDFDPDTNCESCLAGRVLLDGVCIVDLCVASPCDREGHGQSCKMVKKNGYECTCLGDFTPESDCTRCPAGQEPDTGHTCKTSDRCEGVNCGAGASCDGESGACECTSAQTWMNPSGDCVNPCSQDPCHIEDGGHGATCEASDFDSFTCTCSGGHTPQSFCQDCPAGKMSWQGTCVNACEDACSGSEQECKDASTLKSCELVGPCREWIESECSPFVCRDDLDECAAPEGMVLIPGDDFVDGQGQMQMVEDFFLDVTEVSVDAFTDCVQNGPCVADRSRVGDETCNYGENGRDAHPMNCVSHDQARAFCGWQGKRLPSGAEWEWAARGREWARVYPWGSQEPNCALTVMKSGGTKGCGLGTTWPVGSKDGDVTRDGVLDMGGNVEEWTADEDEDFPGSFVFRGGAFAFDTPAWFTTNYSFAHAGSNRTDYVGFRCAQDSN